LKNKVGEHRIGWPEHDYVYAGSPVLSHINAAKGQGAIAGIKLGPSINSVGRWDAEHPNDLVF
jgi:hypothetical protein